MASPYNVGPNTETRSRKSYAWKLFTRRDHMACSSLDKVFSKQYTCCPLRAISFYVLSSNWYCKAYEKVQRGLGSDALILFFKTPYYSLIIVLPCFHLSYVVWHLVLKSQRELSVSCGHALSRWWSPGGGAVSGYSWILIPLPSTVWLVFVISNFECSSNDPKNNRH